MDTQLEEGFLETTKIHSAGDEFQMEGRSLCLLKLSVGSQAHARTESWKKREQKLGKKESKSSEKRTASAGS